MKSGSFALVALLLLPGCAALDAVQRVPKVDVIDAKGVEPAAMPASSEPSRSTVLVDFCVALTFSMM